MRKDTFSGFLFLVLVLAIPVMVVIQSLVDRFFPFGGSIYITEMASLIITGFLCLAIPQKLGLIKLGVAAQTINTAKTRTEFKWEFIALLVVAGAICAILFESLIQSIPVLGTHLPKGGGAFGFLAGIQLSKYLGHKWGWIVEHLVETKPKEQS